VTELVDCGTVTLADLHALRGDRCLAGASGLGNLDDFAHCYGSVSGCECNECREGQSSVAASAGSPSRGDSMAATPPALSTTEEETMGTTTYSEDELYAAYLRQTGRPMAGLVGVGGLRKEGAADAAAIRYLPGTCSVSALRGKTLAAARTRLAAGNCRLGTVRTARSKQVKKGRVVSQTPTARGEAARLGTRQPRP
jgi:hypothetical protein